MVNHPTPAMIEAGEQAMLAYYTPQKLAALDRGEMTAIEQFREQLAAAYLAMRRLDVGPRTEGLK